MNDKNQMTEDKQTLSAEQKQKMKKYAVFALLFIIFGACLWLIFAPSADDKAKTEATQGFNADIPMPTEEGIIGDKQSSYEEEQLKQKQQQKMQSLQDFAALLGEEKPKPSADLALINEDANTVSEQTHHNSASSKQSPIRTSASAYRNINRSLETFYDTSTEDAEKERLAKELEEAKAKLEENENHKSTVDEQMDIMDKSYQMAAKYMPQMQGQDAGKSTETNTQSALQKVFGKSAIVPVTQTSAQIVSALQQDISDTDMVKAFSQPHNLGFFTATATVQKESKNTIQACVHDNQTVMDGQSVRLQLLEPMQVGNTLIPRNTLITGKAKIQGERLDITITSLEYAATIIPVQLWVFDANGQQGIFIPNTAELNAAKEIVANMGTSAGTSISLTSDAGQQLAADLGRSVIQGASQYVAKKLREVKVNLKASYKVFLLPENK